MSLFFATLKVVKHALEADFPWQQQCPYNSRTAVFFQVRESAFAPGLYAFHQFNASKKSRYPFLLVLFNGKDSDMGAVWILWKDQSLAAIVRFRRHKWRPVLSCTLLLQPVIYLRSSPTIVLYSLVAWVENRTGTMVAGSPWWASERGWARLGWNRGTLMLTLTGANSCLECSFWIRSRFHKDHERSLVCGLFHMSELRLRACWTSPSYNKVDPSRSR